MISTKNNPLVLIIAILLTIAAIFLNTTYQQNLVVAKIGQSNEYAQPASIDTIEITTPYNFELPLENSLPPQLNFKYRCVSDCQLITISIHNPISDSPTKIIMRHPLLIQNKYTLISNNTLQLYQKQLKYTSIDQIMTNPPPVIAMDPYLFPLIQDPRVTLLNFYEIGESDDPDSIITTYQKPRIFGTYDEFSRIISNASPNQSQLSATISAYPETSLRITKPEIKYVH